MLSQRSLTGGQVSSPWAAWRFVAFSFAACTGLVGRAQSPSDPNTLPQPAPKLRLELVEPVAPAEPIVPIDPAAPGDIPTPLSSGIPDLIAPPFDDGEIVTLGEPAAEGAAPPIEPTTLSSALGYNTSTGHTTWLIGQDDRFGMVSLVSTPTHPPGEVSGVVGGLGFHFLDGPVQTDMPPRLFDLSLGYQRRRWVRPHVGYDLAVRVGVFTDFEGSVRDGVRFPGHAVVQIRSSRDSEWLLGVDVLDRDDVSLLPVFGVRWAPYDEVRLDLVFPRPSAAVRLTEAALWAYVRGELGGGTWAIERVDLTSDNATYRDFRLAFGVEDRSSGDGGAAVEIAYVFGRELSYRSGNGDFEPKNAVMLSFAGTY